MYKTLKSIQDLKGQTIDKLDVSKISAGSEERYIKKEKSKLILTNMGINYIDDHKSEVGQESSFKQLEAIDPKFMKDISQEIFNTIKDVFKIDIVDIKDIVQMKKGMTNLSFLFTVNDNRYVFRVPGRGTDLLITRSQESIAYDKIKTLNISDEIVYIDPNKGYKITKYYSDIKTLDPYNDNEVKKAMNKIKTLHQADLKVEHSFDIAERISFYKSLCVNLDIEFSKQFYEIESKIVDVLDFIVKNRTEKRLCHIDPVCTNFLVFADETIKLIDWEYAGMSDPIMDVAMFGIYQTYSKPQVDRLLELYLDKKPSAFQYKVYYSYVALASYLWYLWTIYKEALGDYYGDYRQMQFNFALKYSDLALLGGHNV